MVKHVLVAVPVLAIIGFVGWRVETSHLTNRLNSKQSTQTAKQPLSYQALLIEQEIIKQTKPAPAMSALFYAYVSSVYQDVLAVSDQPQALEASTTIMKHMTPQSTDLIDREKAKIVTAENLTQVTLEPKSQTVLNSYVNRFNSDGHDLKWDGVIPAGPGKWFKKTALDPLTPRAGSWQRWVVNQPITVPAPPVPGSEVDKFQLQKTAQASASRNGDQVNKINFWGGTPGTEGPSGIWLNQLYRTTKADLPKDNIEADKLYANIQKELSQTLSDSFMECWKVKFTYWTARPDMLNSSIKTSMPNPPFPSYVSGHATISKAAADVLSVMIPKYQNDWQAMAVEARDSRLNAGIHFEIDNTQGFLLGDQVAAQVISEHNLVPKIQ